MPEVQPSAVVSASAVDTAPRIKAPHETWGHALQAADPWYQTISACICAAGLVAVDVLSRHGFPDNPPAAVAAAAGFPLAAFAMYTRLALGLRPMLLQTVALAITTYALPSLLPALTLQAVSSCLVGGLLVSASTRRGSVVAAGLWAGLVSAVVFTVAGQGHFTSPALVSGAAGSIVGGVLSGALVLTLSPLAERVFRHVTSLSLLESLSYDHPLLRQLMTTAPGTFLHSANVAVLCDAAALAVGADALALRAGALYHDVGKTRAPEFFIENQDGMNLFADLTPAESADVLRAHVTDGRQLVNKYGLGPRLEPFVREHHGTSLMRSLASKAEPWIDISVFKYRGPRPRSRETGLLMIADQVEATARALLPGTIVECRHLVRDTIDRIVGEGQLVDSGLTRVDLDAVVSALADVIYAIHHRRTKYPGDKLHRMLAGDGSQS
jgi:putative nucleotidyltransferase with HDIG domain